MSEADGAACNSEEGGRIINLEIQGLEECRYLRTLVDKKMKTVKDLVDKLTGMIPELKESDNIKIYQGKYLILWGEDMSIINVNEEIIVKIEKKPVPKIESKEYIEEFEEKKIQVEDVSLMMTEDDKKREELRMFEEKLKEEEEILKKMKTVLVCVLFQLQIRTINNINKNIINIINCIFWLGSTGLCLGGLPVHCGGF